MKKILCLAAALWFFGATSQLSAQDVQSVMNRYEERSGFNRVDPGKTAVMSRVPLLPQAIRILKRYESDGPCKSRGKLLPVPSNSKMNAYLKELAGICNIPKNLTTHCARHTFATLAIEYSMPIDIIAKILGHTNTNMTRHYARISEANISREMRKIGKMLTA